MLFIHPMLNSQASRLYGSAPSGKKLTKGRLTPEDFRNKSQALLADVQVSRVFQMFNAQRQYLLQEQFETLKIDEGSAGSSTQHHEKPPSSLKVRFAYRFPTLSVNPYFS